MTLRRSRYQYQFPLPETSAYKLGIDNHTPKVVRIEDDWSEFGGFRSSDMRIVHEFSDMLDLAGIRMHARAAKAPKQDIGFEKETV